MSVESEEEKPSEDMLVASMTRLLKLSVRPSQFKGANSMFSLGLGQDSSEELRMTSGNPTGAPINKPPGTSSTTDSLFWEDMCSSTCSGFTTLNACVRRNTDLEDDGSLNFNDTRETQVEDSLLEHDECYEDLRYSEDEDDFDHPNWPNPKWDDDPESLLYYVCSSSYSFPACLTLYPGLKHSTLAR